MDSSQQSGTEGGLRNSQQRIDAFTDAAFAFAVTLMVTGTGGMLADYQQLQAAMSSIPSFAIAFAIMVMFWLAHVRARSMAASGDRRFLFLTLALVFAVLLYIHPLRAMAASFASYLSGQTDSFSGRLGELFALYGVGFTAMSLIAAALFWVARQNPELPPVRQHEAKIEVIICLILGGTGLVSTLFSITTATAALAPFVYATLPLTIGGFSVFAARGRPIEETEEA